MIIFGTHHKTGTELVSDSSKCFDSAFPYSVDIHWSGKPLGSRERVVHFTRNPISLALSGYLYHKDVGESWTLKPGFMMDRLAEDPYLQLYMTNKSESYTDFLRRVDEHVGIRAEITHMNHELLQIERAEKTCSETPRCMQVCLEEFTRSSSSYDAAWRKVLHYMGKHVTKEMQRCLWKQDLHRNPDLVSRGHVTSSTVPEHKYNYLRGAVLKVDKHVYNGRLKKMAENGLNCGEGHDFQSEDGYNDGYTGWFVEEKYS